MVPAAAGDGFRVELVGVGAVPRRERVAGEHPSLLQGFEESGVAARHLAAGTGEGVYGGLKTLEEAGAQETRGLELEGVGLAADPVRRRRVPGEGELLAVVEVFRGRKRAALGLDVRPERVGEPVEEAGQEVAQRGGFAQDFWLGKRDGYLGVVLLMRSFG